MLQRIREMDHLLNLTVGILVIIGVFFIYSAAYDKSSAVAKPFYEKQILWALLGLGIFCLIFFWDYRKWVALAPVFYFMGIVFLLLVLFVGRTKLGAQRWLSVGGFAFQPSEFSKLTLILALAAYLNLLSHYKNRFLYLLGALGLVGVPILLILKQPDLGTAMIYVPILFSMLYVAGVPGKYLLGVAGLGAALSPCFWFFLKEYQKNRLLVFINPARDPFGSGYHLIQSKIAIGSGGVLGKGWLEGTQNQLNFLPERHTDFIFSVIGEEWGFLRVLVILALYAWLIVSALHIASQSQDSTGKFVAAGIAAFFATHVFINIGMTIGIMPITGVPLPFLSYGGTSLLTMMAAIALLQNIASRRFYF